ncbi:RHS repeat-associated core domain-containing protein, partial [Glaciecola siphonariae]
MNGRIYDYNIGRFLSVDPFIQGTGSQGINPYSYVLNNPLSFTDPTGYSALNNDGSICDGDLTGYCQTRSFEVQGTSSGSSKATQTEEAGDNGATNYLTSIETELLELGGTVNTAVKSASLPEFDFTADVAGENVGGNAMSLGALAPEGGITLPNSSVDSE